MILLMYTKAHRSIYLDAYRLRKELVLCIVFVSYVSYKGYWNFDSIAKVCLSQTSKNIERESKRICSCWFIDSDGELISSG